LHLIEQTFAELSCSWPLLKLRVEETAAAESEAGKYAESLKAAAAAARSKLLLHHAEDIADLAQFLREEAGVSRTTAAAAATEAVAMKITTAKKMAKLLLVRKAFELSSLGLDEDDQEDVEIALRKLLQMQESGNKIPHSRNVSTTPATVSSPLKAMEPLPYPAAEPAYESPPTLKPIASSGRVVNNSSSNALAAALPNMPAHKSLALDPAIFKEVIFLHFFGF